MGHTLTLDIPESATPELYRVKKPIPVVVRPHDGTFLASFLDANVNASGETE
jgi:hypothetical protein